VATLIREYEQETESVVPRRGNIHDMGRTITHKRTICRLAYLQGKLTPQIARQTFHSPEAVDRYILDFARVYFAIIQRGMTAEETAFAIQRPLYLVEEYSNLIKEFGLEKQRVYDRVGVRIGMDNGHIEPMLPDSPGQNERREHEPITG
jgi:hypothetical protein